MALPVYAFRAAPSVLYGDSAEMQTVAQVGGVAHATGYPTFILLGQLFSHLGWADHAYRITFMSSFFGAAAVTTVVLLLTEIGIPALVAFAGALIYGGTFTFMSAAVRSEVYTLAVFLSVLALWRTLVALRSHRDRDILLAGFLLGVSLTGHLAFAIPVMVLGLALAWSVFAARRARAFPMLLLLLGVFLAGLTPYLYLVWADAGGLPMDALRIADRSYNPLGRPDPSFDNPWERVWWLVTGRGTMPVAPLEFPPRGLRGRMLASACILFVIELGPLALPLAIAGLRREWRGNRGRAALVAVMAALSAMFAVVIVETWMLLIFLIPCVIYTLVFVVRGLEGLAQGLVRRRGGGLVPRAALCLLAPLIVLAPAHGARHWLEAHPIPRLNFRFEEEAYLHTRAFLPTLRGTWGPRRFGEEALAVIPRGSMVVARWRELTNLFYFQLVEDRRPDLVLQPWNYPPVLLAIERWQRTHAPSERPVVFVGTLPEIEPHFTAVDSLRLPMGTRIVIARHRLRSLDRP